MDNNHIKTKCNKCNEPLQTDKLDVHYAICHILWQSEKNKPKYFYSCGRESVEYSNIINDSINRALICKKNKIKIKINRVTHEINLKNFTVRITRGSKWCCFSNIAYLSASFNDTIYDYSSIRDLSHTNNDFPYYNIFMRVTLNKLPLWIEQ